MTEVATASQPRNIPHPNSDANASLRVAPPNSLGIPVQARSFRNSGHLSLDTFSPVNQNGSFDFDRIIKSGKMMKRTRKTKSWKPIFLVLRPNVLSIYRDQNETKLRHQINLSELTAIARQKDPKRPEKSIFGIYSPSRNYHFDAESDKEAQAWVEVIRREARIDEHEEEMSLTSPGGAHTSTYHGFGRSIDAQISPGHDHQINVGYASSSDAEALSPPAALPRTRGREPTSTISEPGPRQPSYAEYSGVDRGSYSDLSDIGGPTSRLSALSLTGTDPRPSTSSMNPPALNTIYGSRPSMGTRNASQMSGVGLSSDERRAQNPAEEERVVYQSWIYLLKSKSGVRQWKKVWLVIRPKGLALYKNEEEYSALLILSLENIIDAVEIDPISKSKDHCLQVLTEERNYRFCAFDEESLTRCLGTLKSLLSKRRAKKKDKEQVGGSPVAVSS